MPHCLHSLPHGIKNTPIRDSVAIGLSRTTRYAMIFLQPHRLRPLVYCFARPVASVVVGNPSAGLYRYSLSRLRRTRHPMAASRAIAAAGKSLVRRPSDRLWAPTRVGRCRSCATMADAGSRGATRAPTLGRTGEMCPRFVLGRGECAAASSR